MRADDDTPMKAVKRLLLDENEAHEDEVFTRVEWMKRKYAMLRKETWTHWILTRS